MMQTFLGRRCFHFYCNLKLSVPSTQLIFIAVFLILYFVSWVLNCSGLSLSFLEEVLTKVSLTFFTTLLNCPRRFHQDKPDRCFYIGTGFIQFLVICSREIVLASSQYI